MVQASAGERQDDTQSRIRGRFAPGCSGNPAGGAVHLGKIAAGLFAAMAADYGGPDALSATDRVMLEQAARLLSRSQRTKDPDSAVRLSNAAARLIGGLRKTAKHEVPHVPLRDQEYPDEIPEYVPVKRETPSAPPAASPIAAAPSDDPKSLPLATPVGLADDLDDEMADQDGEI